MKNPGQRIFAFTSSVVVQEFYHGFLSTLRDVKTACSETRHFKGFDCAQADVEAVNAEIHSCISNAGKSDPNGDYADLAPMLKRHCYNILLELEIEERCMQTHDEYFNC